MKFKEYRKNYQYELKDDVFVGYFFSVPVSYIFNQLFFSEKLIPNYISFAMLCCGLIGGFLFSFSNLVLMIIGYIFMHLWFVFDCWDGAVARQTKKFSKYGKEFDYVVHLLVHPVMIYGISRHTFSDLGCKLCMFYLIINCIKRGSYLLEFSKNHVKQETNETIELKYPWYYYILDFFYNAPNFILIAPIFVFVKVTPAYFLVPFIIFESFLLLMVVRKYIRIYLGNCKENEA